MTFKQRIFRNIAAGTFGRGINALGPLLVLPCYLRNWGPNLYGEWMMLTSIPACLMLVPDFGIAGVAANRIAKLAGEGSTDEAEDLFNSLFWFLGISCLIFGVVGSLIAGLVPWNSLFSFSLIDPGSVSLIIGILAAQLACQQLFNCIACSYRCALKNSRATFLQGLVSFTETVAIITALCLKWSPVGLSIVLLGTKLLGFFAICWDSTRTAGVPRIKFRAPKLKMIQPLLLPALGHGGMPILQLLQNQGLLTFIGATAGSSAVAVFQSIRTMTNGVKSIFAILAGAVLTELPHALGTGDSRQVGGVLRKIKLIGTGLALCTLCGTIAVGRPIFNAWTSGTTEYDSVVAILLAISLFPFFWSTPASIYLHAANRLHTMLPMSFIFIGISSGVVFALGRLLGVQAAALATITWEFLNAVALVIYFRRESPETWTYYSA